MNREADRKMILLVDDSAANVDVMCDILNQTYTLRIAIGGEDAIAIANQAEKPDLILLDVRMPGMDGFEVCRRLKQNPQTSHIPVIFVTGLSRAPDEEEGLKLGAVDYITKPVSPSLIRARIENHLALAALNRELESKVLQRTGQLETALRSVEASSLEAIHRLARAAEFRDADTGTHTIRMSEYAAAVARQMGMDSQAEKAILHAAPLHDVGKIATPDGILLKPGKLDAREWQVMRRHTTDGGNILSASEDSLIGLAQVIACSHHEKWDGSGYPLGLSGDAIPLPGRITAIADVFDALQSERPYKEAFSLDETLYTIRKKRGTHFDPEVVDAFIAIEGQILMIREKHKDDGLFPVPDTGKCAPFAMAAEEVLPTEPSWTLPSGWSIPC